MKKLFIVFILCLPVFLQAQSNAIQSALKNYDYELAVKLISKERKSPENDFLKAKCYKNLTQYKEAILLLEELVKQETTNLSVINELADNYQLDGNLNKAKLYYFMALQSAPNSRFARLNYLNIVFKLKDWKQSVQLAHAILKKDSVPALYPVLGDCFVQLSKPDSAIFYYQKAFASNPNDYNTLSKLAKMYLQAERYPELISSTKRYMLSDSSNQVINQYNGIGLCMNKNYDLAIQRLNKMVQRGDDSFLTNYYLGAAYFATEDYISAYDQLNSAYHKDSANLNLHYYLGKSAIMSGHHKEGIYFLNKGLSMMIPKDSVLFNYYYNISKGYNLQAMYTDEIKYMRLCYKCNSDNKILYNIASTYDYSIKDPEEALVCYNQFMATRSKTKTNTSSSTPSVSYYNIADNRIKELKTELETKKKKP